MIKFRSIIKNRFFYISCAILILFTSSRLINQEFLGQVDDDQIRLSKYALKGLTIAGDLDVQVFATEPMLKNPTNIDVDEHGRVWVTEAYNYRPDINGNPTNEKGDRIIILEDTDGDGVADTTKVFYQGSEINSPLGISVLGNRVIVSQSPYVWAFYDDDGDDKADRKEIIFQGIGGEQHDHGMHAFVFGPDGKLYFNFGNEGVTLKDKDGNPVRDQDGDVIGPEKYKQGMIFRSDLDGTNVECLGDNFRNNYELAVDSYGGIWQSDNDDDGNRGTRINYILEYGNYGYTDEMTGASWSANRTNREDSIPLRHWHLNDPGVVPNLLQTGAGSPSGILLYEGSLLPSQFHNQMIHAEPGRNVVRSYSVKKDKAGYTAEIIDILKGEQDKWFRPADVCIAPDGSLIIADWYDPGVGGHQAGDQQKGRIYRVAPKGSAYKVEKQDYSTPEGAILALQNPNLGVRYLAWEALENFGQKAVPALEKLWKSSPNPRMQARAFWVLVKNINADKYIKQAIKEDNPDLRMMAIRAARQSSSDLIGIISKLVSDKDPQVRREAAIALHHNTSPKMPKLWAKLAVQHDGKDRWYLEALGIGAADNWDKVFLEYAKLVPDPLKTEAGRDIVWRARTDEAIPYLAQLASDSSTDLQSRLRYFRAFDFNLGPAKGKYLLAMIEENTAGDIELNKLILSHIDRKSILESPVGVNALEEVLRSVSGSMEYLNLIRRYNLSEESQNLLNMIVSGSNNAFARNAVGLMLDLKGIDLVNASINNSDTVKAIKLIDALGGVGSSQSIDVLQNIVLSNSYDDNIRIKAANRLGASMGGEDRILVLLKDEKVPEDMIFHVVDGVKRAWRKGVYLEAMSYLPNEGTVSEEMGLPILKELNALNTNIEKGKVVFQNNCSICHQVNNEGFEFGPALSEIGTKLPKEALLEAIVQPSDGISFGYETWQLQMKDGSIYAGIIASKTESDIELLYPAGIKYNLKTSDVKSMKQMPGSMMPALHDSMSKQELADMLAYLVELKSSN